FLNSSPTPFLADALANRQCVLRPVRTNQRIEAKSVSRLFDCIWFARNPTARQCNNCVVNARTHRAAHETFSEDMKKQADHSPDSSLSETMVARIEINELGDPAHQSGFVDMAADQIANLRFRLPWKTSA